MKAGSRSLPWGMFPYLPIPRSPGILYTSDTVMALLVVRQRTGHEENVVKAKIQIRASEVVADLRNGLTNSELMKKYHLSERQLHSLFAKLRAARLFTGPDFEKRIFRLEDTQMVHVRKSGRFHPIMGLPVYSLDDLTTQYTVRDISEKGFHIIGMSTKLGERKSFVVQGEDLADVLPFTFEAECRWVKADSNKNEFNAGFEIVNISNSDLSELRKLVEQATFSSS
jgi:hypothetical protein